MKKCSVCGREFKDENDYCDFCGIKLDTAEGEPEVTEDEDFEEESSDEPEMEVEMEEGSCTVCGTKNPESAKFCMSCAAKLTEEDGGRELTLVLPGDKEVTFSGDRMVFGREDFEDLLPEETLKFISRRGSPDKPDKFHFSIFKDGNEFFIVDEDSSNNTWLSGEKIKGEGEIPLKDGDEIKPANEVSIGVKIE